MKTLAPAVLDVLASAQIVGNRLAMPLAERPLDVSINQAIKELGGLWDKKTQAYVFAQETEETLAAKCDAAVLTGQFVPLRDLNNAATPSVLARQLVQAAAIEPGMRILEPSAGGGGLAHLLARAAGGADRVWCIEIRDDAFAALAQSDFPGWQGNFLTFTPADTGGRFDRVVMHPPLSRQEDVRHVRHAWDFLVPQEGSRLTAIMSAGFTFRSDRASRDFRDLVAARGTWQANPDGVFKSAGTSIRTVLVVLDHPGTSSG